MREIAIRTDLQPLPVFLPVLGRPRTILQMIHGTVAKQTVKLLCPLMAREKFACTVFKKTIRILHMCLPFYFGLTITVVRYPDASASSFNPLYTRSFSIPQLETPYTR